MHITELWRCDRCGAEIDLTAYQYMKVHMAIETKNWLLNKELDLCQECNVDFRQFMEAKLFAKERALQGKG